MGEIGRSRRRKGSQFEGDEIDGRLTAVEMTLGLGYNSTIPTMMHCTYLNFQVVTYPLVLPCWRRKPFRT